MASWVSIDGVVTPGAQASVSVFDRGFLYGDSIYEVLRTVGGRPLFWEDHLARLRRSATFLHLPLTHDDQLTAETGAVLDRVEWGESYIRIIVTRGVGDLTLDPTHSGPPTRVVIVQPLPRVPEHYRREGCALCTFRTGRRDEGGLDPRAKSGNRLLAVLAQAQAHAAGAYEALTIDPLGRILEGATSTFFLVEGNVLRTPPLAVGILEGITRAKILNLARERGIPVREEDLHLDDLSRATEAFITSSVRGVVPAQRIDDRVFGSPGPVTRRLMVAYESFLTPGAPRA